MTEDEYIAKRLDEEAEYLLNKVKVKICVAIMSKKDLSLGTIGEIASLLGLEAVVTVLDRKGKT